MAVELIDLSGDAVLPECNEFPFEDGAAPPQTVTFSGQGGSSSFVAQIAAGPAAAPPTSSESEVSSTYTIVTSDKNRRNRQGNIVQIAKSKFGDGLSLENYKRNPVVLYAHGFESARGSLPVGMAWQKDGSKVEIKGNANELISKVYWDQGDQFAMNLFRLSKNGMMRAASIGFGIEQGIRIDPEPQPKGGTRVAGIDSPAIWSFDYGGWYFTKTELREWSVCALGADPDALRQAAFGRRMDGGDILEGKVIREMLAAIVQRLDAMPKAEQSAAVAIAPFQVPAHLQPFDVLTPGERALALQTVEFSRQWANAPTPRPAAVATPAPAPATPQIDAAMFAQVVQAAVSPLVTQVQTLQKQIGYVAGKPV